jgi:hypothetical protein
MMKKMLASRRPGQHQVGAVADRPARPVGAMLIGL